MAKYDNQPSKFEAVGNGSFLYRYNIQEVQPEVAASEEQQAGEGQAQEQQTERPYWECEEVLIWAPVTSDKITKAVIEHCCSSDREQKLCNEYNAANLGMYGAKTSDEAKAKIQAYKDFLEARATLKAQVDADCEELHIK